MAFDRMRRWPMFLLLAVFVLLIISLLNSWSVESDLQNRLTEMGVQLNEGYSKLVSCKAEKNSLDQEKLTCKENAIKVKTKLVNSQSQVNRSVVEYELCKTELLFLKNLQTSKSAMLDTLRLHKKTLTDKVNDYEQKIRQLEKEIEVLKTNSAKILTQARTVNATSPQTVVKSSLNNEPIKEPALEIDAKEIDAKGIDAKEIEAKEIEAKEIDAKENDAKENVEETNVVEDPLIP